MEEPKNNSAQNLGIAALITAILAFVIAVIPCIGVIAPILGIIAIVLAAVGLSQAARNNAPRGVLIAGLVVAIIACLVSVSQITWLEKIGHKIPQNVEKIVNDVQDNVLKDLKDADVSIKISSGGDSVEIKANASKKDREKMLEELEKGTTSNDTTVRKK